MPVGVRPDYTVEGISELHYNPLQQYRNVTYNVRLTMMPRHEAPQKTSDRSYNYTTGQIMMETGGTGTINLESLRIKINGPGNNTANYMVAIPASISMELIEPIGGRFIESLSLAAWKLGYRSNTLAIYLLEVWFTGYDENDQPVVCQDWNGNTLIYRWYTRINDLKATIDYKGSKYEVSLVVDHGGGLLANFQHIEEALRIERPLNTIQDICKGLEEALNRRQDARVRAGTQRHPHRYVIQAHPAIAGFKIESQRSGPSRFWNWLTNSSPSTTVSQGTTISSYLTNAMANSTEFLEFLHRVDRNKKGPNATETNPNSLQELMSHVAIVVGSRMREDGDDILFDNITNDAVHEIHIYVTTTPNPKIILSPQEYIDANTASQRNARVQTLLRLGILRKAYSWIYTGENTEVIKADIRINNLWRVVRPLLIESETGQIITSSAAQPTAQHVNPAQQANPARASTARTVEEGRQQQRREYVGGAPEYTEDLPNRSEELAHPHLRARPPFYYVNQELGRSQIPGNFSSYAGEYSVYKQIHANVGAGSVDMNSLDLTVVGDPYYLAQRPPNSNDPSKPVFEETVWEWQQNHWTDESLARVRGETITTVTRPAFWFEATVPAADFTSDDVMNLRPLDSVTGIYHVNAIENVFQKGKFTTELKAFRDNLANPWTERGGAQAGAAAATGGTANGTGPNNAAPRIISGEDVNRQREQSGQPPLSAQAAEADAARQQVTRHAQEQAASGTGLAARAAQRAARERQGQ